MTATPKQIAAAWAAWKSRHGEKLGPGPAFVEAINAALDADDRFAKLTSLREERDRLRGMVNGCDWYWPEDDTSSDACADGPWQVAENADLRAGDIMAYSRGGVVETRHYGWLPPAEDSDSDDNFEVDEASEDAANAKMLAEMDRRALIQETSE